MEIAGLGIYNYDRQLKDANNVQLLASFDFGQPVDLNKFPVTVFLIPSGNNAVIKYTPDTYHNFAFNPGRSNKMVAFLPGHIVASFTHEDFNNIPANAIKAGNAYTFIMRNPNRKIDKADELDDLLAEI